MRVSSTATAIRTAQAVVAEIPGTSPMVRLSATQSSSTTAAAVDSRDVRWDAAAGARPGASLVLMLTSCRSAPPKSRGGCGLLRAGGLRRRLGAVPDGQRSGRQAVCEHAEQDRQNDDGD